MNAFVIDKANLVKDSKIVQSSILIENNKISAMKDSFTYYAFMKMRVDPFIMTPVHVMCDLELPLKQEFSSLKNYFINEFISKGCTTILTSFSLQYEYQFLEKLKEKRTSLLNSPLDYTLGISVPADLITQNTVKLCKDHKIPIIWVALDNIEQLKKIKWGWIKGLLYNYPITFVPFFTTNIDKKLKMKHLKIWQKMMKNERIQHFSDEIQQKTPLPMEQLKKIGIYPHRGNFIVGGEISYNLYMRKENSSNEEHSTFKYEDHVLKCTMNKGKCFYSFNQGYFYPGVGEEIIIHTPGYFI
ncbi:hypothetical protein [Rossellomorea aquimaris]|uniref:hypothetical protein n=1 Tax=Rossellomorea aquimaris TaxID=189382 RepID=UPI0007D043A9|nr:hypothetical protein [Rossellomorea aquimaris]